MFGLPVLRKRECSFKCRVLGSQGLTPGCSLGGLAPHCSSPHHSSGGRTGCRGCLAVPHRTCRTTTTSCRLHWKAYGHDCPQVGMAGHMHNQRNSCSLDTGQQVGAQSWEVTGCVLLLWESRAWWHWVSIFPHCMSFPLVRRDSVGGGGQLPSVSGFQGITCPSDWHMWEKDL